MLFKIIDKTTGEEVSEEVIDELIQEFRLDSNDLEGFAITEEGQILLCDECGRFGYLDEERFSVVYNLSEMETVE